MAVDFSDILTRIRSRFPHENSHDFINWLPCTISQNAVVKVMGV